MVSKLASEIKYTKKDLQILLNEIALEDSPISELLIESKCSPKTLKEFLSKFPKEYQYVYTLPLKDVPKTINDYSINGYCRWRWIINK